MPVNMRTNRVGGIPILPNLPSWLAMTQGNIYHVLPYSGNDNNDGSTVDAPLKTLTRAQALATADQNDIVFLYSESQTAASTTDYQSSTLSWAKDGVHLIGVGSGGPINSRARVAFISTYNTASNLFTLSADNCYIANVSFIESVAGTNPTGCFKLTGERNRIENCHIAMANTANDIASSYEVYINGGGENLFKDCIIGTPTILRGANASCASLIVDSQAERNMFQGCKFLASFSSATNCVFMIAGLSSLNDFILFEDCQFINCLDRAGTTALTYAFSATNTAGGTVILVGAKTGIFGATDWNNDSGNVTAIHGSVTAGTFGLGIDVTK
jgi:hypothetical protein